MDEQTQRENQPDAESPGTTQPQIGVVQRTSEEKHAEESLRKSRIVRYGLFAAGFSSWIIINSLIWQSVAGDVRYGFDAEFYALTYLFIVPINLFILLVLFVLKKTRPFAWGILTAIGVNFLISMALGLTYNAYCMIPFFNHP